MNQDFAWMLRPTAQETWVSGKGIMVWLSFAFGLVGAGSYLVSLFLGNLLALVVSWAVVTVLKNLVHLLHAKRPARMWRMVLKPGKSWIARGTIITFLFSGFGLLQLLATRFLPGTVGETILKVIAGLMAAGVIVYEGCTLGRTRAIPFWNNGMVPVVFVLWAVTTGFGFVLAVNHEGIDRLIASELALGLTAALLVCMALYLWGAKQADEATAASATEIVSGSLAAVFWTLVVLVGTVAPGAILAYSLAAHVTLSLALAIVVFICQVIGSTLFVYCVLKAGKYRPVVD
jgi:formate-dependent nitrite reductase membrane component NrfD